MYKTTNGGALLIDDNKQFSDDKIQLNIFPNPINIEAEIDYYLNSKTVYLINLLDNNGKKIDCLKSEVKDKGKYQIRFNSNKYDTGVYFIELKTKTEKLIKKLIISHK
jgi:hypothetical protein